MMNPSLTEELEAHVRRLKEEVIICARCGIEYVSYGNIGTWKCKQHIVDDRVSIGIGDIWPCCGVLNVDSKRRGSLGCILADHREINVPYGRDDIVPIPTQIINNMKIPTRAFRGDIKYHGGALCVSRCDYKKFFEQKNTSDNVIFKEMY